MMLDSVDYLNMRQRQIESMLQYVPTADQEWKSLEGMVNYRRRAVMYEVVPPETRMATSKEGLGRMNGFVSAKLYPVNDIKNIDGQLPMVLVGSSYEDCDRYVREKNQTFVDYYFVWSEPTLHCHSGLRIDSANDITRTESADFGLWCRALEIFKGRKIPETIEPVEIDESELVPCQFPEFHTT